MTNVDNLALLHKATISFDYLHTNSTTHEFLFGAIAELVDNSRDANADNLHIDIDGHNSTLSVLDDGCGMSREEAISVISFGHSLKKMESGMIGQYGNGLKSGAMRIAKDFILFTKKNEQLSCLLLSRTFHQQSNLKDVFVPTPSFRLDRSMMTDNTDRHRTEMSIIYKYSPYKSQDELFAQFDKIKGKSGTLIVLYNLRRLESGQHELDMSVDGDIRLSQHEDLREEERNSLRAYLSVLYINPRMKIYLREEKIKTIKLLSQLFYPYRYKYLAKNFKACAQKEYELCQKKTQEALEMVNEAKSELGGFMNVTSTNSKTYASADARKDQRLLNCKVSEREERLKACQQRERDAKNALRNPTPLMMYFGINIHHRNRYGCMIYNNGRLIEMYRKASVQKEKNDLNMRCLGVIGIVDVPYSILEPTHNKQGFANRNEFNKLMKAMNDHMEQYWADVNIASSPSNIKCFWRNFGYYDSEWSSKPSPTVIERIRRYEKTGHAVQCDRCLKWRLIEFQKKMMDEGIPSDWCCEMHPNTNLKNCARKEDEIRVKDGKMNPKAPEIRAIKQEVFTPFESPSTSKAPPAPTSSTNNSKNNNNSVNIVKSSTREKAAPSVAKLPPPAATTTITSSRSSRSTARYQENSDDDEDDDYYENIVKQSAKHLRSAPVRRKEPSPVRFSSGRPPVKKLKPSRKAAIISSDEDEDVIFDDEIVVEDVAPAKKPKTKADLRKHLESESNGTASTCSSVVKASNGSDSGVTLEKLKQQLDKATKEKDAAVEEKNSAIKKIRQVISALAKNGSKTAATTKLGTDEALMEANYDQLIKKVWEEMVGQPQRERNEEKLQERDLRRVYPNNKELNQDMLVVMKWAQPERTVTASNCYDVCHDLAHLLRDASAATGNVEEEVAE